MSSKFLITGATGSIDRNVVEFLLERGHKVRAFVHVYLSEQLRKALQLTLGNLIYCLFHRIYCLIRRSITFGNYVFPQLAGVVLALALNYNDLMCLYLICRISN